MQDVGDTANCALHQTVDCNMKVAGSFLLSLMSDTSRDQDLQATVIIALCDLYD